MACVLLHLYDAHAVRTLIAPWLSLHELRIKDPELSAVVTHQSQNSIIPKYA